MLSIMQISLVYIRSLLTLDQFLKKRKILIESTIVKQFHWTLALLKMPEIIMKTIQI